MVKFKLSPSKGAKLSTYGLQRCHVFLQTIGGSVPVNNYCSSVARTFRVGVGTKASQAVGKISENNVRRFNVYNC